MTDPVILDEADKAFIAAMQQIDAESDSSVKEWADSAAELRKTFVAKVEDKLNHPLKVDDVDGNSGTSP